MYKKKWETRKNKTIRMPVNALYILRGVLTKNARPARRRSPPPPTLSSPPLSPSHFVMHQHLFPGVRTCQWIVRANSVSQSTAVPRLVDR